MDLLLTHFARSLSGAENLEQLTRPILLLLQRITGLESTYLTVIDEVKQTQTILFSENTGDMNIPEGLTVQWFDTLCKRAMDEGTFYTPNVPELWGDSEAAQKLGLKTYLTVPVNNLDGGTYGTLCGASSESRRVDQDTFDVLKLCSELIAYQIARDAAAKASILRANRAEERLEAVALISAIGELCFRSDDFHAGLTESAALLEKDGVWHRAVPFELQGQRCRALSAADEPWMALAKQTDELIPLTDALFDSVHPDPFLAAHTDVSRLTPALKRVGLSARAVVALVGVETAAGRVAGILLAATEPDAVDDYDNEQRLIISCSNYLSLLAERAEYLEQLERANQELSVYALHDPLTGLANRRYLIEELARMLAAAQRNGGKIYVAFMDLDGFKQINDEHGHDVGDQFLQSLAVCLRGASRAGDLVSRYGGDEFVVLSSAKPEEGEAGLEAFLGRLRKVTCGRFDLPEMSLDYAGPSVGGVVSHAGETDPDALLARADDAMYAIKKARKSHPQR
ncbi:sensor domain-containing diguanylate cyclase [Marinobacter goseongensis]|uniref:sensor domain-containing diguanylate cyclase n=1 Tax=Marinobacter goseongensis TaxID=453838 RepID=UPI002004B679|nr:sensor domain-containing diguanylate cyclase [Marinobacter goseongensis]MCK7549880.1 sensor domain-containing diguanylate cyclase [Marinobacter goseongensis]